MCAKSLLVILTHQIKTKLFNELPNEARKEKSVPDFERLFNNYYF